MKVKSYLAFEGSDYGYCFVTQSNGLFQSITGKFVMSILMCLLFIGFIGGLFSF